MPKHEEDMEDLFWDLDHENMFSSRTITDRKNPDKTKIDKTTYEEKTSFDTKTFLIVRLKKILGSKKDNYKNYKKEEIEKNKIAGKVGHLEEKIKIIKKQDIDLRTYEKLKQKSGGKYNPDKPMTYDIELEVKEVSQKEISEALSNIFNSL